MRKFTGVFALAAAAAVSLAACDKQSDEKADPKTFIGGVVDGWPVWGHGVEGMRHSANTQITPANVRNLQLVWTYRTGDLSPEDVRKDLAVEATPILANNTLYLCSPRNRIIALDPVTGTQKWMVDAKPDTNGATVITCRGVSYWKDTKATPGALCSQRIFAGTIDGRLLSLDAVTGKKCDDFGNHGEVNLHDNLGYIEKPGLYGVSSAPTIAGDLVITGSKIIDFHNTDMPGGVVRAFDARSGKVVWAFTGAPPDMPSRDANYPRSAPNVWAPMSLDLDHKLIFLPTGTPQVDAVIGKGDWDYYGSSIVALNVETGQVVWHYQLVHKDIWDYDTPSQPLLFDFKKADGSTVPALAQATKMGYIFVLNRLTGEPLFPVKETPVPQGGLQAGLSPTQPIPQLPEHQITITRMKDSDIFGFTFFDRNACLDKFHKLKNDGIFTPFYDVPSIDYPTSQGGMDWGGLTFDPGRNILVVNSTDFMQAHYLGPHKGSDGYSPLIGTPYRQYYEKVMSPFGAPCNAPPWGKLAGIDMGSGKKLWEVPLGNSRDEAPWPFWFDMGSPNQGGAMTTASGLTFIAATTDRYFRAFETATGKELWRVTLPAAGQAIPMTFRLDANGKQYVVISAGGHSAFRDKQGDYVVAYALP